MFRSICAERADESPLCMQHVSVRIEDLDDRVGHGVPRYKTDRTAVVERNVARGVIRMSAVQNPDQKRFGVVRLRDPDFTPLARVQLDVGRCRVVDKSHAERPAFRKGRAVLYLRMISFAASEQRQHQDHPQQ